MGNVYLRYSFIGFINKNWNKRKSFLQNRIFIGFLLLFIVQHLPTELSAQNIFSYGYQNVSRNDGGGTLEKGDTIEVRALVMVVNTSANFYYIDTIRPGTKFVDNSLRVLTNEGLTYLGPYPIAGVNNRGIYDVSGGIPRIRVNLGVSATAPVLGTGALQFGSNAGGGKITPTDKPRFYGKSLFIVAYRLVVTAEFNDIIYLTGNYYYDSTYKVGGKNVTLKKTQRFDYAGIKIIQNQAFCPNFSSASFTAESDFGTGKVQNRPTGANVPGYNKVPLNASDPQDGNYAIANNTSATGSGNKNGPSSARVFGVWDIIGDHTGAADPVQGNPPAAAGTEGGYMLVVNAAFPTGEAYRDRVKNLCPNTYYEFSAWVRNICGGCGIDLNSNNTGEPGVQPNLAFTINDIDYYTTGSIPYTQEWVKRGFIYKTGPTETEFDISIKNNAPGGGGNDWVLDDIKLSTCYPDLIMNPNDTAKLCANFMVHLSDTVQSYYNNYNSFCWQRSLDGINWTSTGNCGTAVPVFKNGLWVYIVDTVFTVVEADSGTFYRVKVATTFDNLGDNSCAVDNSQKVFLQVYSMDCKALEEKFLDFSGKLANGFAELEWTPKNQYDPGEYEIERSPDGINFKKIGVLQISIALSKTGYRFIDPDRVNGDVFYRLKLISKEGKSKTYSKTIRLFNENNPFKMTIQNPFRGTLKLDVFLPSDGELDVQVSDILGKLLVKKTVRLSKGNSQFNIPESENLPKGWYILRTMFKGQIVQNRLFKD